MVKNKIKKALSAALSGALAFSFCLGGFPSFHIDNTAFAESETEETLEPGDYSAPLFQYRSGNLKRIYAANTLHYSGKAILHIDEERNQSITFKVENWSLYDAFIPGKQEFVSTVKTDFKIPSSVFNEDNKVYFKKFDSITTDYSSDANNDYYLTSDHESKFGDITIVEDEKYDSAYVTFAIDDYKNKFMFLSVLNTPTSTIESPVAYIGYSFFGLDTENLASIDKMQDSNTSDWAYSLQIASARAILNGPVDFVSAMNSNYTGHQTAKNVFDSGSISQNTNGSYTAKFHVNTDGTEVYTDFKVLTNVSHQGIESYNNWDLLHTGSFEELSIDSNGFVSFDYDSLIDAQLGKLIFFDTDPTDNTVYYCSPSFGTKKIERIELTDSETGIKLITDTSKYPSDIKMIVEKNKDFSNDSQSELYNSVLERWNSSFFSSPYYYTITLTDGDGNELIEVDKTKTIFGENSPKNVDLMIPISDDFSFDTDFFEVITPHGNNSINNDTVISSGGITIDSENHYLKFTNKPANGYTYGFMKFGERSDVYSLAIPETGSKIYETNIYLMHGQKMNSYSMADAGIVRKAYIVCENGEKKLYFKSGVVTAGSYIGDIYCDDLTDANNSVYEDSAIYTNFDMSNGELTNNVSYDAYTEMGNVTGTILTLVDDSYIPEIKAYAVALIAGAMNSDGISTKVPYDTLRRDAAVANLIFTDLKDVSDSVTLDTILNEGYGYHSSALLRRIKQVELEFASNKGEAKLEAALAEANDVYTAKYADAAAASKAYEAAIAKLDEFEAGYDMTKNLPDGKYIVHADMVQLNRVDASMSDAAINHDIVVNVKDGKATVQVEFKGLAFSGKFGYLSRLWNYDKGYTYSLSGAPSGTMTEAKVLSKYDVIDEYSNDYPPHYLEFELVDGVGAEWVPLHVYVPVMTGSEDQDVNMHIDWSTARKAGEIAEYEGNSLSLKDDFGLNFFFNFGEQTLNDAGAKVQFTLPDGSVKEYVISETPDDDKTENGYRFSANVAAKEMTAPVKAQIILSNGETSDEFTCSVKEYADKLLASSTNESEIKLVKSILNYGGYAQEYFGYNESALANADIDNALGEVTIAGTKQEKVADEDDGIDFYGSSLVLNTKIDLRAYFTLEAGAEISDYTFMFGDTELTPVKSGNKYYVAIPEITSKNIDQRSAIDVTNKSGEGELSVKTGPYAYIHKALTKSSNEKLQNLAKALYFYSQAAENYTA